MFLSAYSRTVLVCTCLQQVCDTCDTPVWLWFIKHYLTRRTTLLLLFICLIIVQRTRCLLLTVWKRILYVVWIFSVRNGCYQRCHSCNVTVDRVTRWADWNGAVKSDDQKAAWPMTTTTVARNVLWETMGSSRFLPFSFLFFTFCNSSKRFFQQLRISMEKTTFTVATWYTILKISKI